VSTSRSVQAGVAQGSIPGQILYSMYLYYVSANEVGVNFALYTDDTALFNSDINASRAMLYRRLVFKWNIEITRDSIFKEREITRMSYPATWTRAWQCTEHEVPWCNARKRDLCSKSTTTPWERISDCIRFEDYDGICGSTTRDT
jgi:hypothetical protein